MRNCSCTRIITFQIFVRSLCFYKQVTLKSILARTHVYTSKLKENFVYSELFYLFITKLYNCELLMVNKLFKYFYHLLFCFSLGIHNMWGDLGKDITWSMIFSYELVSKQVLLFIFNRVSRKKSLQQQT